MANLRVDKITSTETFETTGSVQFDGTGDYLTIPENTDFQLASSAIDFTIEAWVYGSNFSGAFTTISAVWGSFGDQWILSVDTSGVLGFAWEPFSNSANFITGGTLSTNTWYHVSITRSGNTFRLFLDGVIVATGQNSGTTTNNTQLQIGKYSSESSSEWEGHISNVRIIKGKALYTANFKPPMRELEVTPETTLLCCQSKTDTILEKTGKTITANGNAVANELTPGILTPVPKAGAGSAITGSVEFDGTGDYLSLSSSSDFAFGTGDFTVEGFINRSTLAETDNVIDCRNGSSGGWKVQIETDGDISFFSEITNGFPIGSDMFRTITHEWYHFAFTRSGGTLFGFINGVLIGSASHGSNYSTSIPCIIGARYSEDQQYHKGFISNLRIVKGTALYTDNFIPPTRELEKVPNTVLLCCQDPDNPLTEATGKTITGHGNLDTDTTSENLITNGNFTTSASDGWTVVEGTGSTALGTAQSGTFNDGNHLVLTATSGSFVFLAQQFTTKIGSTYLVNVQSNGADASFISTDSDKDNAIITDIRNTGGNNKVGDQTFVATQTSYYMILRGGTGGGNFDTASVYKVLTPNGASNFTPQVGDDRQVTFEGVTKVNSDAYFYLPTGDTESRYPIGANTIGNGRAVFSSGTTPSTTNTVDYITISSKGDAQDFGGMGQNQGAVGTVSDSTRGIFAGGQNPVDNRIEYITISSTGDAKDFGDMTRANRFIAGAGNAIRGCLGGGLNSTNTIDYITIQSMGNAFDFGDLVSARGQCSGLASPTRGIFAGGHAHPSPSNSVQVIDFISIMSTGNAQDFGDLINNNSEDQAGASNEVRGLFAGGSPAGNANQEVIQYITIASTGDATDFGNLVVGATSKGGAASPTRAVFAGGYTNPGTTMTDAMDFVTITSTGNAQDFGDLTQARDQLNGVSNAHGGLG